MRTPGWRIVCSDCWCCWDPGGILYYNWHTLMNDGYYYPKMSGIAPLGMLAGLSLLIIPSNWQPQPVEPGTPATARRAILAVAVIFSELVFGIALGFVNLHLTSNYTR